MKRSLLPLLSVALLVSFDPALAGGGAETSSAMVASPDQANMVAACKNEAARALGTLPGAVLVADPSPRDGGFVSGGKAVDDSGEFQCLYGPDGAVVSVTTLPSR